MNSAFEPTIRAVNACLLIFAERAEAQARRKGLVRAQGLFEVATRRLVAEARGIHGIDVVVVGAAQFPGQARIPQRGRTFADRLVNADADVRALGYREVIIVGTDTPELASSHIREALAGLRAGHPVLGPSHDGGVYLIASDRPLAAASVRWRGSHVAADLRSHFKTAITLEALHDLDHHADFQAIRRRAKIVRRLLGLLRACREHPKYVRENVVARHAPEFSAQRHNRGPPR